MSTKILDEPWTADPAHPGRIAVGDAIDMQVRVAIWRVPGGDAEAQRLVEETEALCLAAPAMANALLLNGCRNPADPEGSAWHTHDCWESKRASCTEACKATVAALSAAGVEIP